MGLFINSGNHPDLFKKKGEIEAPNQESFRKNYFRELVDEQKQLNELLTHSVNELIQTYQYQETKQLSHWQDVRKQLNALMERSHQQQEFENHTKHSLHRLDQNYHILRELLDNESILNKELNDQVTIVKQSNEQIVKQLEVNQVTNEKQDDYINELIELNKQMSEQMLTQEDKQNNVVNRLEKQEALMEKTVRQMDNLRSIMYERASYLAEQVENGYNLTSTFFYKLLTDSDQPLNLLMMKQPKQEDHKRSN